MGAIARHFILRARSASRVVITVNRISAGLAFLKTPSFVKFSLIQQVESVTRLHLAATRRRITAAILAFAALAAGANAMRRQSRHAKGSPMKRIPITLSLSYVFLLIASFVRPVEVFTQIQPLASHTHQLVGAYAKGASASYGVGFEDSGITVRLVNQALCSGLHQAPHTYAGDQEEVRRVRDGNLRSSRGGFHGRSGKAHNG